MNCFLFSYLSEERDDLFRPLLENPKIFLLGAAGQFGIFLTIGLALFFGFAKLDAVAIGVIGACDGPTAIYVTQNMPLIFWGLFRLRLILTCLLSP